MGIIDQIKPRLRKRHIHIIIPSIALTVMLYLFRADYLDTTSPGLIDYVGMFCFLISMAYLFWYGARIAPWRELRSTVTAVFLTWFTGSFIAGVGAYQIGMAEQPMEFYMSLPAGMEILSLMVGLTGLMMILIIPFSARYVYRIASGNDGSGGGETTPEEQVLNDEELEDFDHPWKNLYHLLQRILPESPRA